MRSPISHLHYVKSIWMCEAVCLYRYKCQRFMSTRWCVPLKIRNMKWICWHMSIEHTAYRYISYIPNIFYWIFFGVVYSPILFRDIFSLFIKRIPCVASVSNLRLIELTFSTYRFFIYIFHHDDIYIQITNETM